MPLPKSTYRSCKNLPKGRRMMALMSYTSQKQRTPMLWFTLGPALKSARDLRQLRLSWRLAQLLTSTFLGPRYPQHPQAARAHAGPTGLRPGASRATSCHIPLPVGERNSLPRHTDILCLAMLSWPFRAQGLLPTQISWAARAEGTRTLGDC